MKKQLTSLVTGCAGFIGSHVSEELLKMNHRVVGLDDLSGGFIDNIPAGIEFHQGSTVDNAFVDELFAKYRFDYVFHLAAYAAEGLSHFIKRFNYTNNLLGSVNLINASVNTGTVECFVFTSSIAVYGPNQVPMTEDLVPQPEDPYGIAKYAIEMDLKESHEMFGLDFIVFRPHNVYGERQNIGDKYRNVIGIFMNQILRDEPMTIFGDGKQTRAFSYISDVAPIIARSVERQSAYNQVFNVGADKPYTVLELAEEVAEVMGVTPNIRHLDARKEVVHAFSSHDKLRNQFGDLLRNVPLIDGLGSMATWVRTVGSRESSKFEGIEVVKNMPRSWAALIK
ncbi:MAG: NAD-dependent epimerase/dehydratase family protein [Nitrososphaerota archaeon]|nr:NAD-dependent epimerase/dehydratase family protein [Nitrososphaerota archaeon]